MTWSDRVRAVEALGFTTRQARFLVVVALHSGYCLRRQYAAFASVAYGKSVRDFLDALVAKHLATRFMLRADRGHLYHLHARPLYRVLGQEDNRNRRPASAALIARKLMLLDAVLSRNDVEWVATEEDKVALFAERLRVPHAELPQRVFAAANEATPPTTRYFPHKLPVAIVGDPPGAQFLALVTDPTGRELDQFLQDHAALLRRLSTWSVIAVGPDALLRQADCARAFDRFLASPIGTGGGQTDDLRWYFTSRRMVDGGDLSRLSMDDIARFRRLRARFAGATIDARYREWTVRGDDVLTANSAAPAEAASSDGRLIVEALPFDYRQFGSLPGVA